ncbi:Uncharacterised protein [Vibrio cholerae]|nr:Uncharacterised protein [Vibrio cholerae]
MLNQSILHKTTTVSLALERGKMLQKRFQFWPRRTFELEIFKGRGTDQIQITIQRFIIELLLITKRVVKAKAIDL